MESDDIYRFIALRSVEQTPRDRASDPFIDAYGSSAARTALLRDVEQALARNLSDAINSCRQRLTNLSPVGRDSWSLVGDESRMRKLALTLSALVRRGDRKSAVAEVVTELSDLLDVDSAALSRALSPPSPDAEALIAEAEAALAEAQSALDAAEAMDLADSVRQKRLTERDQAQEAVTQALAPRLQSEAALGAAREFISQRSKVADVLLCQTLVPDLSDLPVTFQSIDTTAQLILCLETIERLLGLTPILVPPLVAPSPSGDIRANWWLPLKKGKVVMPLEICTRDRYATWTGDLILLRQQVRGYRLGEIAHVENVLAKESFDRTFRTLRRKDERIFIQEDSERETETDVQGTTRDELRTEIDKAKSENFDIGANFDVQVTYVGTGYTIAAGAGGSVGYSKASDERTSIATAHTQEVISKARERIVSRVFSERETLTSYEQEDTVKHDIQNQEGDHIVGVYRWLEKQIDLHLVNYGRRQFYEFMVPEPATFWTRLVTQRGDNAAGDPPPVPALPDLNKTGERVALRPDHFALRTGDVSDDLLSEPAQWNDLLVLAGEYGVELETPPPVGISVHTAFALDGKAAEGGGTPATATLVDIVTKDDFSAGNKYVGSSWYAESPVTIQKREEEPLKVPAGYHATDGSLSLKGWKYIRAAAAPFPAGGIYEWGMVVLHLNGVPYAAVDAENVEPGWGADPAGNSATAVWEAPWELLTKDPPGTTPPKAWTLEQSGNEVSLIESFSLADHPLAGDVPLAFATNLNGLSGSIRLDCERTLELERGWAQRMYTLFAAAYQQRMVEYNDARTRAGLANASWSGSLPAATCREIERTELQRGVMWQLMKEFGKSGDGLAALGLLIEDPDDYEPATPVPSLDSIKDLAAFDNYTKTVSFFQRVFDWANMSYLFVPYIYGRRGEWPRLAVADDADAQFKKFLTAGAARVQVPVFRGFEQHAKYFFCRLGIKPLDERLPVIESTRSIAEDLAAEAREGFEIGEGTLAVGNDDDLVAGTNTNFTQVDERREIRINRQVYIIGDVISPTRIRLTVPYQGEEDDGVQYETGGIVVGPVIETSLPTTLVAIDKSIDDPAAPPMRMPEFPPRYVQRPVAEA